MWIKRLLYSYQAYHVETLKELKLLLAAADQGVDVLTGSLAALRNDVCFFCGKSGHFHRNCPHKNFDEPRPHYALPDGGRGLDGGPRRS
jgi:hypothetical protein